MRREFVIIFFIITDKKEVYDYLHYEKKVCDYLPYHNG